MLPISYRITSESLVEGETYRDECPECGRKDTFTMTRKDGAIVWNCFSAHCSCRGMFGATRTNLERSRITPEKPKFTPYEGDLEDLNDEQKAYLLSRIGFTEWHIAQAGVRWAPADGRYAYPIYSPSGSRRGWVLRSYDPERHRRKTLTRMDREEPHLSWYQGTQRTSKLLVVEDIPSAVKSSYYFPGWCVAMCGGGVGPDYVREILAHGNDVTWAFDPDATHKAVEHSRDYGLCFSRSRVLPLVRDLKDMGELQLKETLEYV